jgi:pimeloyl-ACP methyl ester carboxylesterase
VFQSRLSVSHVDSLLQPDVQEFHASVKGEEATREFVDAQRKGLIVADAAGIVAEMSSILPDVDKRALLDNGDVGSSLEQTFKEALKHNSDGWVDDDLAFVKDWGFQLDEISVPVFLYQGSVDLMVPYGHGKWLAQHLPKKNLTEHLIEGEGHISIWLGYMESMLQELSSLRA